MRMGIARSLSWRGTFEAQEPKFEAEGRERGRSSWEGQRAPSHQLRGPGERCKLPQRGPGRIPEKMHFGRTKSPETRLVAANAPLVVFTPYIVIISFTNCYIHIFSSSAASVFNKLSSVQFSSVQFIHSWILGGSYRPKCPLAMHMAMRVECGSFSPGVDHNVYRIGKQSRYLHC